MSFDDSHQFHGLQPAFTKQVLIIHALNLRANYMDKEKVIQTRELIRRGHFKEFFFSKFCNLLNNDRVVASKRYLRNGSDRFDFVEVVFGDEVYLGKVRAIMVCFESIFLIINDFVYASSNARKVHPDVDIPYFKLDTDCSYDGTKFSVIETKDVKSLVHVIECPHKPNYFFWNKDVLL